MGVEESQGLKGVTCNNPSQQAGGRSKERKEVKRLRFTDCTEQEGEGCPETSGNTWREEDPQQEMADPLDFKDKGENKQEKLFSTSTAYSTLLPL